MLLAPVSYGRIVSEISLLLSDRLGWGGFGSGWVEFVANIALFAPLGLLLTLLLRSHWLGAGLAVAVSVAAEVAQVVIPARQPSLRDILANAAGAAAGAAIAWLIIRRDRIRVDRVRPDEVSGDV